MEKEELEKKIEKLEKENQELKALLDQHGIIWNRTLRKMSTLEKIRVFRSYFHGREDVFARIYHNRTKQAYGWSIACDHAFKYELGCRLGKAKHPCANCPRAAYATLSDEILYAHFTGKMNNLGIGIYPILPDHTCFFLALDFDDERWFEDMYSVYQTAVRHKIYPIMERSASGAGGHLWFFFAEACNCASARQFGEFMLRETMKRNRHLKFSSFDRMFPNQDRLPEGGFGNLIALPLRASAYRNGNTAFINKYQQVIANPVEFLSIHPKISLMRVAELLRAFQEEDYFFDDPQPHLILSTEDVCAGEIRGTVSGMLNIDKTSLNAQSERMLKRMASMYNPAYFMLQRLHKPIYHKTTPKVLSFYEEDDQWLYLPRGLQDIIRQNMPNTVLNVEDRTAKGEDLDVSFRAQLYPSQQQAAEQMLQHHMGVLKAATGFGKTIVAIYMIAALQKSTLIIVSTTALQEQWAKQIMQFLCIPETKRKRDRFVCKINGTQKRMNHKIDIATAASLANLKEMEQALSGYGLVIIDECHRAASNTFTHVLKHIDAEHIYGLSATPKRKDGLEKAVYMFCGPVRCETDEVRHSFEKLLIPRMTTVRLLKEDMTYAQICEELAQDMARNYLILKDVKMEYEQGGHLIILSERKDHLLLLYQMMRNLGEHIYMLTGETSRKARTEVLNKLERLNKEDHYILLATSRLLGEGFDLPALDVLFLALPIAFESRIIQYTGRIHRETDGKTMVIVYDYVDAGIKMMQAMFQKRLKQYEKEGYHVQKSEKEVSIDQILFTHEEGEKTLICDLKAADKEVIMFVSMPLMNKIKKVFDLFQEKHHQGISLYFVLSAQSKNKEEEIRHIEGMGGKVIFDKKNYHFTVIDRRIVWLADFDWLGRTKFDGYAIRLENDLFAQTIKNDIKQAR